jgi:hypothetical protein
LKQAKEAVALFKSIANKCCFGLGGNHELKLFRIGNMAELICDELGVEYATRTCRVVFTNNGSHLFNGFATHDLSMVKSNAKDYIQATANVQAALKNQLQKRMGDCAIMIGAHIHQLIVVPPTPQLYLVDGEEGVKARYLTGDMGKDGGFINPDQRWFGCSGSFRKRFVDGIDDYSDIYSPNELGCLIVSVEDGMITNMRKFIV